jgi:hypothetical protein
MGSDRGQSAFTNEELAVLKQAFDQACSDLGLAPDRRLEREHLAALIFRLATAGEMDCATLRRDSAGRFRLGEPWVPIDVRGADVIALSDRYSPGTKATPDGND